MRYPSLWGGFPRVTQPSAARHHSQNLPTRERFSEHAAARLACVRHAASVHPEPGSNSPLNASRERDDLLVVFN